MTNADRFKTIFGLYATELWAMPEKEFLKWLNADATDLVNKSGDLVKDLVNDCISRQAAVKALEETKQSDPFNRYEYQNIGIDWSIDAIKALPSAQLAQDLTNGCTDTISRQAAIEAMRKAKDKSELHRMLVQLPSAQPGCEDTVPRTSVEYICRKNTVSTNPYEHKYHDKFIQFMDDPGISDFGRWQHSNGFNTALVAVKCDLDKVPSVTPKPWEGKEQ